MSSDFENFLIELTEKQLRKIEQGFIAQIISFDKEKMTATISPRLNFINEDDGEDTPQELNIANIDDIPVQHLNAGGAYIRPNYRSGDLVNVHMCSSPVTSPLQTGLRATMNIDRFQLNSCIIIGGVIPSTFVAPASWSSRDGLLIGNTDALIEILADEVTIEKGTNSVTVDNTQIELSNGSTGTLTLNNSTGQVDINGNFTVDV